MTPICNYCGNSSHKVTGADIYPHRPDLAGKVIYQCKPCDAYVGCHPGTDKPLGRLANADLRKAKSAAHAAFDPMWKAKMRRDQVKKHEARGAAYAWLSREMNLHPDDTHIGMFDIDQCRRVLELCAPYARSP